MQITSCTGFAKQRYRPMESARCAGWQNVNRTFTIAEQFGLKFTLNNSSVVNTTTLCQQAIPDRALYDAFSHALVSLLIRCLLFVFLEAEETSTVGTVTSDDQHVITYPSITPDPGWHRAVLNIDHSVIYGQPSAIQSHSVVTVLTFRTSPNANE